jgi:putative tryptophan/tyrosine transport system substrate-binding protein
MAINIVRRKFITGLGTATIAWPLAARAQQPASPVIGFLNGTAPDTASQRLAAFREGLKSVGYVEGQNVTVEYRWAEGHNDRLPAMAADLVSRRVSVIVATGGAPSVALAAKAATTAIPIVFANGGDPVKLGLVPSLNRPVGNLTGVSFMVNELGAKRLSLMQDLVPSATVIGFLVDPTNENAESETIDMQRAADALGRKLIVMRASTASEVEAAFERFVSQHVQALIVAAEVFFVSDRAQLAELAARHSLPAIYHLREMAMAGGLMSYGTNFEETYREVGIYTGRVLKGAKPSDLPVIQSTKFELVINLKTAKALGLTVPLVMQMTADEVIE